MLRMSRTLSGITAVFLAAGAVAPLYGSAMSARGNDRVSVHLVNKGDDAQDIKVDGRVYLVKAHDGVQVKVAAGSIVYSAGKSAHYQEGDKLITITPAMKDSTVYFNCTDCVASGS
ncbi:MAG TPA: hypothetical protein VN678_01645 [Acidobacteriaceae bacterium]|nr:hypothetical protein [Acidobacteriaceae bacterium]